MSNVRVHRLNYKKWVAEKRREILKKVNNARDRANVEKISEELEAQNKLRDFYFSMQVGDLKAIWNNGDNELTDSEREIARIALRNKMGSK